MIIQQRSEVKRVLLTIVCSPHLTFQSHLPFLAYQNTCIISLGDLRSLVTPSNKIITLIAHFFVNYHTLSFPSLATFDLSRFINEYFQNLLVKSRRNTNHTMKTQTVFYALIKLACSIVLHILHIL